MHVVPDGALNWMGLAHLIGEEGALTELLANSSAAPMLDSDAVVLLIVDFTNLPLSEERVRNRGLSFAQAMRVLGVLAADERFAALTITEVNPDHGAEDSSTTATFAAGLVDALPEYSVAGIGRLSGVDE